MKRMLDLTRLPAELKLTPSPEPSWPSILGALVSCSGSWRLNTTFPSATTRLLTQFQLQRWAVKVSPGCLRWQALGMITVVEASSITNP